VLFSICKLARLNSSNLLRTSSAVRIKPTRVCGLLSPLTLYALRFDEARPQNENSAKHSRCLSIARRWPGVLLQKQAEPAAALLPQWLSGYAFLFHAETDFERAKELRASLPANVAGEASPLHLQTDVSGDLARLLAERVAVNARQTGFSVAKRLVRPRRATQMPVRRNRPSCIFLRGESHRFRRPRNYICWRSRSMWKNRRKTIRPIRSALCLERKILEERKLMPLWRFRLFRARAHCARLAAKSVGRMAARGRVARTCSRTKAFGSCSQYAERERDRELSHQTFLGVLITMLVSVSVVGYAVTYYSRSAFEDRPRTHRSARCAISKGVCAARRGNRAPAG